MTGRIDAHMHVWTIARGDYAWLTPDLGPIYRDFEIDDAWPEAHAAGVARVILVQAAATEAETAFMLNIAASDDRVAGVVGWVDFGAPSAVTDVARLASHRHVVGLRPMIADLPDPDWILQPAFTPVLEAMAHHGLVLDAHARHDLVPVMAKLAALHPNLQIVLNHGGKPQIAAQTFTPWRDDIGALAMHANVACKLSGLLTEAGSYTDDLSIGRVVEHLGACFGPERLLWGSDWPVLTLAGSYTGWAGQSERLIRHHFPDHQAMIWGGNSARIYLKNGEL